jgi:hypothetical protein
LVTNRSEKKPKEYIVYKYSNKGKDRLREAVIMEGKPYFMAYVISDKGKDFLTSPPIIEEKTRILRPPHEEEYPYEPYEFENVEDPNRYLQRVKKDNIDSLYLEIRQFWLDFNDLDNNSIVLLSAYTLCSYFQDRFSTVFYLIIVGDNGTGKSVIGDTYESLAYRATVITDTTPAIWYRILGSIEHGQVTIVADEADNIGESDRIMSILKSGYDKNKKISRTDNESYKPEWFYPYCQKIIIAEKSPAEFKARGLLDRSFLIKTYKGFPKYDIKEIRNPQGNITRKQIFDQINDLRKRLLVYRLIHFKDPLPEIDIGLDGRNKELCKPILQFFYGLGASKEILAEIETALQSFIDIKNERKENSLEAMIYPEIVNAVSKHGNVITSSEIWHYITSTLEGDLDQKNVNVFNSADYGPVYRNSVIKMICDKFGAKIRHRKTGNELIFNTNYLVNMGKIYGQSKGIQTILVSEDGDSGDADDAFADTVISQKNQNDNPGTSNESLNFEIKNIQKNIISYQNESPESPESPESC